MAKRGEILAALRAAISDLDIFKMVTLIPKPVTNLNKSNSPACIIVPGDMPVIPLTQNQYTTGSSRQSADGWQIALFIFDSPSTTPGETEFATFDNTYIEPVIEAIINENLSVSHIINIYLQAIHLYRQNQNGAYIAEIIVGIKYDFSKNNY